MRVTTKIKTQPRHRAITKQYEQQAREAVSSGCEKIKEIAVNEISRGAKSGRFYPRGGEQHQASAAGEYPATDSGFLANNIFVKVAPNGLSGEVESKMNYSAALEFGTSKMAARPFMQPSAERARAFIRKKFRDLKAK